MQSLSLFLATAAFVPLCLGAVPLIFDPDSVDKNLAALIPGIKIPPKSSHFGGCDTEQIAAITQAWNDAMDTVIPGAVSALAKEIGADSQLDNIFKGLFSYETDHGRITPPRTELSGKYNRMLSMNSAAPPVNLIFHCTDTFFKTLAEHKIKIKSKSIDQDGKSVDHDPEDVPTVCEDPEGRNAIAFTQELSGFPNSEITNLNGAHITFCPDFFHAKTQTLKQVTAASKPECSTMFKFKKDPGFEISKPGTVIHELAHAVLDCPGDTKYQEIYGIREALVYSETGHNPHPLPIAVADDYNLFAMTQTRFNNLLDWSHDGIGLTPDTPEKLKKALDKCIEEHPGIDIGG